MEQLQHLGLQNAAKAAIVAGLMMVVLAGRLPETEVLVAVAADPLSHRMMKLQPEVGSSDSGS